jgi:hypothetical protein
MNRKIPHWDKVAYPYKLMYKRNEETGALDIIKAYENKKGKIVKIKTVGKG